MLTRAEVTLQAADLIRRQSNEMPTHDQVEDYRCGRRGAPSIPEGAGSELRDLAAMSVKNVCGLVVDALAQSLSVRGFRSPAEEENAPIWTRWQEQRLDARQGYAHRSALTFGASYAVVDTAGDVRFRTPRQLTAVYADPSSDLWPVYALETWVDSSGRRPIRRGYLIDAEAFYPVELGAPSALTPTAVVAPEEEFIPHGFGRPPVVRWISSVTAEGEVTGEVAPLIHTQQAINSVSFDRLVVAHYGAFPQRYVIGWAPSSRDELLKSSMARLMAFDDPDTKAGAFPAASTAAYDGILSEMYTHVARIAQIPPYLVSDTLANLAADTIAMAEAPFQRKLADKRQRFGESWEQLLSLMAVAQGDPPLDPSAEVVWQDTESRSYAQVIDGMVKLASAGVPIDALLEDVPGWSQQRLEFVRSRIQREMGRAALADALRGTPADAPSSDLAASQLKAQFDALGVAIRAGVAPEDAASRLGLAGIAFTGAMPASLRLPADDAAAMEQA